MPVETWERFGSRKFAVGSKDRRTLTWMARGSTDEEEIEAAIAADTPDTYLGLLRDSIQAEEVGPGLWEAEISYLNPDQQGDGGGGEVGSYTLAFDTSGGMQHLTQSLGTTPFHYTESSDPADFQSAINVTEDDVLGVDVVSPALKMTETHILEFADLNAARAYAKTLSRLTGKTNAAEFRTFAAGELLFLGANMQTLGNDRWSVTLQWDCSENIEDLQIGDIINIAKKGHDYIWIKYRTIEDAVANQLVQVPETAYVEVVYDEGDYSLMGVGS